MSRRPFSGLFGTRRLLNVPVIANVICLSIPLSVLVYSAPPSALAEDAPHTHERQQGDEDEAIERIVVTATPLAHQEDELAASIEQLNRSEIIERLGNTIGETLRNVPGVTTSGFSAGVSRPVIRGQDAFRTEVLESGLGTQDVSRLSPDHAVPVNPLTAQRIEIVRGPGTVRYGGSASAGVVNVITNRVPTQPIDVPLKGEVIGIFGQNAEERDFATILTGGIQTEEFGEFAWHFDGMLRESEDYNTGSRGDQPGTSVDSFAASGGVSWFTEQGRVGIAYSRFESLYGIPEAGDAVLIDMKTDRIRLEGVLEKPIEALREVNFRGVYSDYTHDEIADGAIGQTFDNREVDLRVEALHEPILGFVGAAGWHGKFQDLEAAGEAEEFLAASETGAIAFYLFEERPVADHIDLQLGFRAEGVWVEGTPRGANDKQTESFAPVSGSAALVYHPTAAWSIGLTGSAGQRAPSQVELFARGPHEATATFETGNEDFDEETSYTGELRATGWIDRVRIDTAVFVTRYEDFIFGALTGQTVDEEGDPAGDELDELFYDARDALFWGGEVEISADLFEFGEGMFGTEWQFDYVRARFQGGSGNRNVPRITPIRWGGRLTYAHDRVNGSFGFLRTESQSNGAAGEFETGSFTMLELTARYRIPTLEEIVPIEIGMVARNLLNQNARNAVAFNKDEVLLPGRSFLFSVHGRF